MITFICDSCIADDHGAHRGGTWCDVNTKEVEEVMQVVSNDEPIVGSIYEIYSRNLIWAIYLGDGLFKGIREKLGSRRLDIECFPGTVTRVARMVGSVVGPYTDEQLFSILDEIDERFTPSSDEDSEVQEYQDKIMEMRGQISNADLSPIQKDAMQGLTDVLDGALADIKAGRKTIAEVRDRFRNYQPAERDW